MAKTAKKPISIEQAKKDGNSTVNQDIKRKFVEREVYCNVNIMVEYILRGGGDEAPFTVDDIENYYSYPEYNGTYAKFDGGTEDDLNAEKDRLNEILEDLTGTSKVDEIIKLGEEIHHLENELETEAQEVYEWWAVSEYLQRKLKERGYPVLDAGSVNVWGRTTTGQAILLDGVITDICAEMQILQGQANSWENIK